MLNNTEINELRNEYYSISDKIRELEKRQAEIDLKLKNNAKDIVASRFVPLEIGDKVRITFKNFDGVSTIEGFFGSWVLYGHQYVGVEYLCDCVKIRVYQIKKDGTRSIRCDEYFAYNIVSIEKL